MRQSVEKRLREHEQSKQPRASKQKPSIKLPKLTTPTVPSWLTKYRWGVIACLFVLVFGTTFSLLITEHVAAAQARQDAIQKREDLLKKRQATTDSTKKAVTAKLASAAKKAKAAAEKVAKEKAEAAARAKAAANAKRNAGSSSAPNDAGCSIPNANSNPAAITVIVNKKHCMQPIDYTPSITYVDGGYPMSTLAAPSFQRMIAASGQPIHVTSAFRSYSDQVSTYNYWVATNGSTVAADTVSARPGYSEHQTGLAADLSCNGAGLDAFANTSCYQWLTAHAAQYGFIQRYQTGYTSITGYSPEPWHWRYVGPAVALDMKARGIHTLEQYYGVSGGDYS